MQNKSKMSSSSSFPALPAEVWALILSLVIDRVSWSRARLAGPLLAFAERRLVVYRRLYTNCRHCRDLCLDYKSFQNAATAGDLDALELFLQQPNQMLNRDHIYSLIVQNAAQQGHMHLLKAYKWPAQYVYVHSLVTSAAATTGGAEACVWILNNICPITTYRTYVMPALQCAIENAEDQGASLLNMLLIELNVVFTNEEKFRIKMWREQVQVQMRYLRDENMACEFVLE
jgi:hypothetical protein